MKYKIIIEAWLKGFDDPVYITKKYETGEEAKNKLMVIKKEFGNGFCADAVTDEVKINLGENQVIALRGSEIVFYNIRLKEIKEKNEELEEDLKEKYEALKKDRGALKRLEDAYNNVANAKSNSNKLPKSKSEMPSLLE